jgi:hypothetical protein
LGGQSAANVTHYLAGVKFPIGKREIEEQARKNGAERPVLDAIRDMPERQFHDMSEVMKAFGDEKSSSSHTRQ